MMEISRRGRLLPIALALLWGSMQAIADENIGKYGGVIREVYPGDNFRAIMAQMQPGDELVFHEGEYRQSYYRAAYNYNTLLYLDRSGTPEKPMVFRGYGNGEGRPKLIYDMALANLCEVRGNNIEISYMEFQPIVGSTRGIRIVGVPASPRSNILIENSVFRGSVGNSIDANSGNSVYDGIWVLNNKFIGIRYTGLYIGEQNGSSPVTNFVFDGNYLDGSQIARADIVGYGMELKLNVKGAVVTNNLIVNTQGPGVMLYGTSDGNWADANIVEYNIVAGSRNSPGILVGAGPSVVRNNMSLGNPGGGIRVYDYGGRRLMNNIILTGNTAASNNNYGFQLSPVTAYVTENITIANNIAISKPGVLGFRGITAGSNGNIEDASDAELEELIEQLKADIPVDPDSMRKVVPHLNKLKHGPFSKKEVKYLVEKTVQKLE